MRCLLCRLIRFMTTKFDDFFEFYCKYHLELVDRSIHPTQEVLPLVISGENACPPEDCGGIHGYKELLEVLKNPKHPEYRETKVWVGSKFNPTNFSVDACNKELGKLNKYIKEYENGF